jgi:Xaa-Pro dipeptidase
MVIASSAASTSTKQGFIVGTPLLLSRSRPRPRGGKTGSRYAMTNASSSSSFHMGRDTLKVDFELHRENRLRLAQAMEEKINATNTEEKKKTTTTTKKSRNLVLLESGKQTQRYGTDNEPLFRQESYFHWMFGCRESDCFGVLDVERRKAVLFVPRLPDEYIVWMGKPLSNEELAEKYKVEEVRYTDELEAYLEEEGEAALVHVLSGTNTDSGLPTLKASVPSSSKIEIDESTLFEEITLLRTLKTKREQEVLEYASKISSQAHVAAIKSLKPGTMEYQLEAAFLHHIYNQGGMRFSSYPSICASGSNAAVLHYGHSGAPNDKECKSGELVLMDMGGEYHCMCADITTTVPVSGKFTPDQKIFYDGVLQAHKDVIANIKPGAVWTDLHLLAERRILSMLQKLNVINESSSMEEMLENRVCAVFMPHGLGHLLGIDTHDVGGYGLRNSRDRILKPGLKSCRTAKALEENNVMTVEPGCYFVDALIDDVNMSENVKKCINFDVIDEKFRGFGGVRIEDNLVVTKDGCKSWTNVPRETDDIEKVMNGELAWPPPSS